MNTTIANLDKYDSPVLSQFLNFANALPEALLLINAKGQIVAANQKASAILKINQLVNKMLANIVDNPETQIGFYLKIWSRSRTPTPANISWLSDERDDNGDSIIVKKKPASAHYYSLHSKMNLLIFYCVAFMKMKITTNSLPLIVRFTSKNRLLINYKPAKLH
ncbi:hypothetical protein [Candidatus Albibeggiatoa sp. nov. BB20]|uniref:hypothetical protein n=1 Tax=Candidatus Albibeggiatoa sp. nov. BB20 TaxID=3162723 RepID=UPI0033655A42